MLVYFVTLTVLMALASPVVALGAANGTGLLLLQLHASRTYPESFVDTASESLKFGFETHAYTLRSELPSPETLLYATSRRTDGPTILFTHLLKAGGSRVEALLQDLFVVSKSPMKQSFGARPRKNPIDDFMLDQGTDATAQVARETLSGEASHTHAGYFRIGSVRSPCDYLLSMWAFQSGGSQDDHAFQIGHGRYPRECLTKTVPNAESTLYGRDIGARFATDADVARFRKWVRATGGQRLHYMSLRSYFALHHENVDYQLWDDGQFFGCMGDLNGTEEKRIADVLASTKLADRYECFIHAESIEHELHACLAKYAELVPDTQRAEFLQKLHGLNWTSDVKNASPHGRCSDYFDNKTEAFVWEREGDFAAKAGYGSCCAGSSLA
jgi:hypothetical protein